MNLKEIKWFVLLEIGIYLISKELRGGRRGLAVSRDGWMGRGLCRASGAGARGICHPTLAGWTNLWGAYGAGLGTVG